MTFGTSIACRQTKPIQSKSNSNHLIISGPATQNTTPSAPKVLNRCLTDGFRFVIDRSGLRDGLEGCQRNVAWHGRRRDANTEECKQQQNRKNCPAFPSLISRQVSQPFLPNRRRMPPNYVAQGGFLGQTARERIRFFRFPARNAGDEKINKQPRNLTLESLHKPL